MSKCILVFLFELSILWYSVNQFLLCPCALGCKCRTEFTIFYAVLFIFVKFDDEKMKFMVIVCYLEILINKLLNLSCAHLTLPSLINEAESIDGIVVLTFHYKFLLLVFQLKLEITDSSKYLYNIEIRILLDFVSDLINSFDAFSSFI